MMRDGVTRLYVYDTAGEERYTSLTQNFVRRADVVVVCYDTSNKTAETYARNIRAHFITTSALDNKNVKKLFEEIDVPTIVKARPDSKDHLLPEVKFELIDTAGSERYGALAPSYLRGAVVVMLVYDVNDTMSFDAVQHRWKEEVRVHAPDAHVILVGTKQDAAPLNILSRAGRHLELSDSIVLERVRKPEKAAPDKKCRCS
nr:hypothetical protein BaRGS_018870 [Batillaria attramentaria]